MSETDACSRCGGDCPMTGCPVCGGCENTGEQRCPQCQPESDGFDGDWDDEPCKHECDENCQDYQGFDVCSHSHCPNCGGCQCPGYCDDHQVYNLRAPSETGGAPDIDEAATAAGTGE